MYQLIVVMLTSFHVLIIKIITHYKKITCFKVLVFDIILIHFQEITLKIHDC